jgi:hypothetical protein
VVILQRYTDTGPLGVDGESHSAPKIPTIISYADDQFTWGAAVNPDADSIVGVKLLLDPSQDIPFYLPIGKVKNDLDKLPKDPVMVAADYIKAVYEYALVEISNKVPQRYIAQCQKEFVLSG